MEDRTLLLFVGDYRLERDVGDKTVAYLRVTVRRFSEWLKRAATLDDLEDDAVNRWLASLLDDGLARPSVKGHRGNLLSLWRCAFERDLVKLPPRRVRKIKCPRTLPEAWKLEQLQQLLAAAEKMPGCFRFVPLAWSSYLRAIILTAWDSGLRLSDLLTLRFDQIGSDGALVVTQSKTGGPILRRLRPETMAAIAATEHARRELVFGFVQGRQVMQVFGRLTKLAGLSGGTKKIRKSGASHVPREDAKEYLGHLSDYLAGRHYIDPRMSAKEPPLPPKIA